MDILDIKYDRLSPNERALFNILQSESNQYQIYYDESDIIFVFDNKEQFIVTYDYTLNRDQDLYIDVVKFDDFTLTSAYFEMDNFLNINNRTFLYVHDNPCYSKNYIDDIIKFKNTITLYEKFDTISNSSVLEVIRFILINTNEIRFNKN